jgi:ribosomal protein L40E
MSAAKKHEIGTGVAIGLVVGGVVATALGAVELPFAAPVGALIGGFCGAYVIYGKVGPSAGVGALSGILSLPFFLGLSEILLVFGVVQLPSAPQPSLAELQSLVVVIALEDVLAGAVGGSILGAVRRQTVLPSEAPETTMQKQPSGQVMYCIQCGAQLPSGNLTCPHCGVKQPQTSL